MEKTKLESPVKKVHIFPLNSSVYNNCFKNENVVKSVPGIKKYTLVKVRYSNYINYDPIIYTMAWKCKTVSRKCNQSR